MRQRANVILSNTQFVLFQLCVRWCLSGLCFQSAVTSVLVGSVLPGRVRVWVSVLWFCVGASPSLKILVLVWVPVAHFQVSLGTGVTFWTYDDLQFESPVKVS